MKLKKIVRFLMLLLFIVVASIVPFPVKFSRKDNLPTHQIEQKDKKEDDENVDEETKALF